MDVLEAIFTRRSIRKFTPDPVSEDDVNTLLKAAMCAPSSHNSRSWHFVVVRDQALRQGIAQRHPYAQNGCRGPGGHPGLRQPPQAKGGGFLAQDCAAALENILLAARGQESGHGLVRHAPPLRIVCALSVNFCRCRRILISWAWWWWGTLRSPSRKRTASIPPRSITTAGRQGAQVAGQADALGRSRCPGNTMAGSAGGAGGACRPA